MTRILFDRLQRKRIPVGIDVLEALDFDSGLRLAGDILLYDQGNPANNEIKQPGKDVGYEATSPLHYRRVPDDKSGVPAGAAMPATPDNTPPATSRVVPDSMGENLRDNLTYMNASSKRVAVMDELRRLGMLKASSKRADLSPPLGYPGGPCHVIERIHNEVPNPRLRDRLVDEIEDGESLSNPDASKVYHVEQERGIPGKFLSKIVITAHAQYRMDLRGITVPEVRTALAAFRKEYFDEKSKKSPTFKRWEADLAWREGIRYYAPSGLVVVFEAVKDEAHIITVFWEHGDPPYYVDETECGFPEAGKRASTRNKTSALIGEILARTGPEVSGKAGEVSYRRTRINPEQGLLLFDVSGSKGETYKVRLKALRKSNVKSLGKLHVQVSCTCPFFRWQGPEHWAKANKFLYGKPEGTASKPDQKDPSGQNWVCKHVYAILDEKKNKRFASQDGLSQKLDYVCEPMPEAYRVAARWARGVR